jgi:hypothetical protein
MAQQQAHQDAAAALPGQLAQGLRRGGPVAGLDHRQGQGEQHHADRVVEQRLAGDDGFHRARHAGRFQDAAHGHRVGGRDERAEHQAIGQRQADAHHGQQLPQGQPHQQRAEDRAHHGQRDDGLLVAAQLTELELQAAGKEQHRQHAPHQHAGEVDGGHHGRLVTTRRAPAQVVQADERAGDGQRHGHDADGGGQADEAVVDVGEDGRDDQAPDGDFKHGAGNA